VKGPAFLAIGALLAIGLSCLARQAHAANARVVVAGPEHDPIASRMQKELVAMGFELSGIDDATGCSRSAVTAWVDENAATAVVCSDGTSVSVWIASGSGLRIADIVRSSHHVDAAPDLLAVRAAEIARARLELPAGEPDGEVTIAIPVSTPQPDADMPPVRRRASRPRPAPWTPAVTIGAGTSVVVGADATSPALAVAASVRVFRSMAVAARAEVPFLPTSVAIPRGTVRIFPTVVSVGPLFSLASADSLLVPRFGGGVGAVWLSSNASVSTTSTVAGGGSTSESTSGTDVIVSPMFYANAALSLRVVGPFRVVLDGLLGTTAHRMVVRDQGVHVAYWGQPFVALAARAELAFQ
jgi:hypothetical protein